MTRSSAASISIIFATLVCFFGLIPISAHAQQEICGPPPTFDVKKEDADAIKGELSGKVQALSKLLGNAELAGRIENERKTIYQTSEASDARRIDAYFAYLFCVSILGNKDYSLDEKLKALEHFRRPPPSDRRGAGSPGPPPQITAHVAEPDKPNGIPGPVIFKSSGAELYNLDWSSRRYYALLNNCNSDDKVFHPKYFRAAHTGPFAPYDRTSKKMLIYENNVWAGAPGWFNSLKSQRIFSCLDRFIIEILYRLEFQDQTNVTFERFFWLQFETFGWKTTASIADGTKTAWNGVQNIADHEVLSLTPADGPTIIKALKLNER